MGETTNIAWTDRTFNPFIGCTKVSPGCDACYAEAWDARFNGGGHWGQGAPRRRTSDANWRKPIKWNAEAAEAGRRPWVFCASLADVFDNEVPDEWRADLLQLWRDCPNLNFQVVTKRVGNAEKMLPEGFARDFPHVGIIATVVNQEECDRDLPKLERLKADGKAAWIGLSIEPQLGQVIPNSRGLDWVITGGESDQGSRHGRFYALFWARVLIDWGWRVETPIFVKQLGSLHARANGFQDSAGADPAEWPEPLRVREMPRGVPTQLPIAA